jgi:hypothetical protein
MYDHGESVIRDCEADEDRAFEHGVLVEKEAAEILKDGEWGEVVDQISRDEWIELLATIHENNPTAIRWARVMILAAAREAAIVRLERREFSLMGGRYDDD